MGGGRRRVMGGEGGGRLTEVSEAMEATAVTRINEGSNAQTCVSNTPTRLRSSGMAGGSHRDTLTITSTLASSFESCRGMVECFVSVHPNDLSLVSA